MAQPAQEELPHAVPPPSYCRLWILSSQLARSVGALGSASTGLVSALQSALLVCAVGVAQMGQECSKREGPILAWMLP